MTYPRPEDEGFHPVVAAYNTYGNDPVPTHHYRWMHHGEYTEAKEKGHFRYGINVSDNEPDSRYQAGDHMLVRFPHTPDFESKMEGNTYSRATTELPFEHAKVVQVNPMVPKEIEGPRVTKVNGEWTVPHQGLKAQGLKVAVSKGQWDLSGAEPVWRQEMLAYAAGVSRTKVRNVSDEASDGDGITNSIMIAIVPPASVVENLALDEGESARQLHVTLAYLGETSEYSEQLLGNLHEIVESWAEGQQKFTATVQGVGTFLPAEEDGQHVLWASIGAPGLHRVHTSLVDYLKGHGYNPRENHGFTPHLTLAYGNTHFRFMPKIKRQTFRVHEVWVCQSGRWESITLSNK